MRREKLPQIDCNNNNNSNEWGASNKKDTVSFYFNYAVHVKGIDFGNCPVNQQQFRLNIYLERRAALSIDLVPDRCNKSWRQRYLLEFRWFVEFSLAPFPRLPIFSDADKRNFSPSAFLPCLIHTLGKHKSPLFLCSPFANCPIN